MVAKEIISAIPSGIRVAIRAWIALRQGKHTAKRGIEIFRITLQRKGLPEKAVEELTAVYRSNTHFLSIRNLSRFAMLNDCESFTS